jgi:predicted DNA binding protein
LPTRVVTTSPAQQQPTPLTDRQREVLQLMTRYGELLEEPPTMAFLARRMRVDRSTIREHLEAIHRKGWLPAPRPWFNRST